MSFTFPWDSFLGGMLLGISASILLLFNGKVCGISGIVAGTINKACKDKNWRLWFILGTAGAGLLVHVFSGYHIPQSFDISYGLLICAGLLVGFGTRIGSGCTSGHGIVGMGRLSKRSIVATCTFMLVAAITAFIRLHLV